MGNCLKISRSDDISLLRGNDSINGQNSGTQPLYHVCIFAVLIRLLRYNFLVAITIGIQIFGYFLPC